MGIEVSVLGRALGPVGRRERCGESARAAIDEDDICGEAPVAANDVNEALEAAEADVVDGDREPVVERARVVELVGIGCCCCNKEASILRYEGVSTGPICEPKSIVTGS